MTSIVMRARVTIAQINEWIALRTVAAMSTMGCVYLFLLWSFLPSINKDWEQFALYVSSGIIQLVALPLIMVGQSIEGKRTRMLSEQNHKMLDEILDRLRDLEKPKADRDFETMFNEVDYD